MDAASPLASRHAPRIVALVGLVVVVAIALVLLACVAASLNATVVLSPDGPSLAPFRWPTLDASFA